MPYYVVEPRGRDNDRPAGVLFIVSTVQEVYAGLDRMVARLQSFRIDPATFEWYVVDEIHEPVARPGAH